MLLVLKEQVERMLQGVIIKGEDTYTAGALVAVLMCIDDFEQAHPGMRDYTFPCSYCGTPMDGYSYMHWGIQPICDECKKNTT